jgi:alcohol dehydrogenase YqhD (iron-dependent ADH family)
VFSVLDPTDTLTQPPRPLANGVFDAITHCINQFLTGEENPLMAASRMATIKELVGIGSAVVKAGSPLELRARLVVAASFALNVIFGLGKDPRRGRHAIGRQLMVKDNSDHGASLAIVGAPFPRSSLQIRKRLLAKAERVFGVENGSEEEKANAFMEKLAAVIPSIGQPLKASDWPGAIVGAGDVAKVTKSVLDSMGRGRFGSKKIGHSGSCQVDLEPGDRQ